MDDGGDDRLAAAYGAVLVQLPVPLDRRGAVHLAGQVQQLPPGADGGLPGLTAQFGGVQPLLHGHHLVPVVGGDRTVGEREGGGVGRAHAVAQQVVQEQPAGRTG